MAFSHSATTQENDIEQLEQQFRQVSQQFYQHKARQQSTFNKLDELYSRAKSAFAKNNPILAVGAIVANLELAKKNISDSKVQYLVARLLEHNEYHTAQALFQHAQESGDPYTTSKFNYLLANYYVERKAWDKAQQYLSAIEIQNALTRPESDYATILFGVIMQMHKQHRESVKFYDRVPDTSDYYGYAQLNKAVAFIRQGWWTDAHIAINNALEKKSPAHIEEFNNRLYLVLGYSQLHHEFYRDARQTFRHIGLKSRYVNQALLGIGLCALHQGDFVGALNAFKLLQDKKTDDIYVTESYLLLAFVYEQMGQHATASAHYSEAIAYYQGRVAGAELESAKVKNSLSASNTDFDYTTLSKAVFQEIPADIRANLARLELFSRETRDPRLAKKINDLKHQYNQAVLSLSQAVLAEQTQVLQSYLSQSQFGVAKLFDSGE